MLPKERFYYILPFIVFLSAISSYLFYSEYTLYHFPLDDAWIHRVYSRSFAFGHGFSYNAGTQEAGSTSPLWAIVTSPVEWFAYWFGTPPVLGTKIAGVICGILVLYLIIQIGIVVEFPRAATVLTAMLFSLEPGFLFSVLSGMETILVLVVWLLMVLLLLRGKLFSSAFFAGCLVTTRPEAVLCIPFSLAVILLSMFRQKRLRSFIFVIPLALAPGLAWSIFCRFSNGHWLPNTFYAKAALFSPSGEKLALTWRILTQYGYLSLPLSGTILYLFANCWLLSKKCLNYVYLFLFFSFIPGMYAVSVVTSRHIEADGYYWTRWVDPGTLLITIVICAVIAHSVYLVTKIRQTRAVSTIISVLVTIWFISVSTRLYASFKERRHRLSTDAKVIYKMNEGIGEWLATATPISSVIAVNDAGAIKYISNRKVIDIVGLNDREILFRKRSVAEVINDTEWLAVFPVVLETFGFKEAFLPIKIFEVGPEEYTICPCPQQHSMVIFRKFGKGE